MKKVNKETIVSTQEYEAFDGTRFSFAEECEKYEDSAAGVLLAKLSAITLKKGMTLDIDGNDDNEYSTIVPKTQEHLDAINQLEKIFHLPNTTSENFADEKDLHLPILMGKRMDRGTLDWVWFYKLDFFVRLVTDSKYMLEILDYD